MRPDLEGTFRHLTLRLTQRHEDSQIALGMEHDAIRTYGGHLGAEVSLA